MAAIKKSDATERVPPYNGIENKIIASPLMDKALLQNIIKTSTDRSVIHDPEIPRCRLFLLAFDEILGKALLALHAEIDRHLFALQIIQLDQIQVHGFLKKPLRSRRAVIIPSRLQAVILSGDVDANDIF
jgi:hypothetical protein